MVKVRGAPDLIITCRELFLQEADSDRQVDSAHLLSRQQSFILISLLHESFCDHSHRLLTAAPTCFRCGLISFSLSLLKINIDILHLMCGSEYELFPQLICHFLKVGPTSLKLINC